ncbi:MAG: lantibiotic dehydratase C-terminal domain-containing protein [Bacteroidota bacterium]
MTFRTTAKWLGVGLYYAEPWEEFLLKAVKPYTDVVVHSGVVDSFFFERSWERGPNIRLWFKGKPYILAKMLSPNLQEHFQQYFESRPSLVNPPNYPKGFPEEYKWLPNNSVQYLDGFPGENHPTGQLSWSWLEKQYEASSLLILNNIKEKGLRWTYNEMISTAIKIHLAFAYAMGMDLEEANHFFNFLADNWFITKYPNQLEDQKATQQSFRKIFNLQRKDTVPYHLALWELFRNYESLEDPWLVKWIKTNNETSIELNFALENQQIPVKRQLFDDPGYPRAWEYYESLVKLTNNRLGLYNKNEGFLLFIMAESLKAAVSSSKLRTRISA